MMFHMSFLQIQTRYSIEDSYNHQCNILFFVRIYLFYVVKFICMYTKTMKVVVKGPLLGSTSINRWENRNSRQKGNAKKPTLKVQ